VELENTVKMMPLVLLVPPLQTVMLLGVIVLVQMDIVLRALVEQLQDVQDTQHAVHLLQLPYVLNVKQVKLSLIMLVQLLQLLHALPH